METLTQVKLRVGDRLWDFFLSVDEDNCLLVEPCEWLEFQEAYPDGMTLEVFDFKFVFSPYK
jgi:hypothetical protein